MESLTTEILQKIFSHLPVHDRIRVERVCKRWKNVSTERVWRDVRVLCIMTPQSKERYHRFKDSAMMLDKFIKMENNTLYIGADEFVIIQSLVSRAGQHVKKFMSAFYPDDAPLKPILSTIAAHCHNLESIELNRLGESDVKIFSKLLEVNKQLHSISCYSAYDIIKILPLRDWKSLHFPFSRRDEYKCDKKLVALIEKSPSLEKFHVHTWGLNMPETISKCEHLKTLQFPPWTEQAAVDLMIETSLLNRLTGLKVHIPDDDDYVVVEILSHCINLKSLGLVYWRSCGLTCMSAKLLPLVVEPVISAALDHPKLESLDVDVGLLNNEILSCLVEFKHLRLDGYSYSITEDTIFEVIKNSECLEKLEIPEIDVTQKFFRKLVRNTKRRCKTLEIEVSSHIYKEALEICKGSKIHVIEDFEKFEI